MKFNFLFSVLKDGELCNMCTRPGTCTHTNDEAQPWWKVTLTSSRAVSRVRLTSREDCCPERLQNFDIYVGGEKCASGVSLGGGETKDVVLLNVVSGAACVGQEIKIQKTDTNVLTLCGFEAYGGLDGSRVSG